MREWTFVLNDVQMIASPGENIRFVCYIQVIKCRLGEITAYIRKLILMISHSDFLDRLITNFFETLWRFDLIPGHGYIHGASRSHFIGNTTLGRTPLDE